MKNKFRRIRKISEIIGVISIFAAIATVESINIMIPVTFLIIGCAAIAINKVCEMRGR